MIKNSDGKVLVGDYTTALLQDIIVDDNVMVMEHDGFKFMLNSFNIMMDEDDYGYYEHSGQSYSIKKKSVYGQIVRMKLLKYYLT